MTMFFKTLILIVCFGTSSWFSVPVEAERILAITPVGAKSHWNFMRGILRALTERGHHVTFFTPFSDGTRENYTEIDISKEIDLLVHLEAAEVERQFVELNILTNAVHQISLDGCRVIYENDIIKKLMTDATSKFDVVFVEILGSECNSYLSAKLNIPLVYVAPPPIVSYAEHTILGHYPNPAVVSHMLNDHSVPRTFVERFTNAAMFFYTTSLLRYKIWSSNDEQTFNMTEPVKPSIVFSNAHYITDASRPLPPSVIPVGGIHLDPPKRIPDDILEFIENSPHGVVVFTLGSVISVSSLPDHIKKSLIEVLGRIPQRVLWKYEHEMKDKPDNVMTRKWFPQRDILLHPNIRLFISHGGISGVYEAVDAGVPVLGFPVFYDQPRNMRNLEDAGMAISMDLKSITSDTFLNVVKELINNEKYKKNAQLASERFKDRPMSPTDTVDYWTKYVVRHKGAPHLKSHAFNLTWYQYFLLDVIAVLLLVFLLVIYIIYVGSKITYKFYVSRLKLKPE